MLKYNMDSLLAWGEDERNQHRLLMGLELLNCQ